MEGGDIDNAIPMKLFFVLEDLVMRIDEDDARKAARYRRRGSWGSLAKLYDIDSLMVAHLWDIVMRSPWSHEFITVESSDEEWCQALENKFDRMNVPHSGIMGFDGVDDLAQRIVYMPNVLRVYHANRDWGLRFGHVGEYVPDVQVFSVQ